MDPAHAVECSSDGAPVSSGWAVRHPRGWSSLQWSELAVLGLLAMVVVFGLAAYNRTI
jgi:hypothetical protein